MQEIDSKKIKKATKPPRFYVDPEIDKYFFVYPNGSSKQIDKGNIKERYIKAYTDQPLPMISCKNANGNTTSVMDVWPVSRVYRPHLMEGFFSIKKTGEQFHNVFEAPEFWGPQIKPSTVIPEHIRLVIENVFPSEKERLHFLNWLSYIYNERKKAGTAFLIMGDQGTGKGILSKRILTPIFGINNIHHGSIKDLLDNTNDFVASSFLAVFDEIYVDRNNQDMVSATLKTYITEEYGRHRQMRQSSRTEYNTLNCLFFSNKAVPMAIEHDDRRISVVKTAGPLKNKEWFADQQAFIDKVNEEVGAFASYLKGFKYSERLAKQTIETEHREFIVANSMGPTDTFCEALKKGNKEYFEKIFDALRSDLEEETEGFEIETELSSMKAQLDAEWNDIAGKNRISQKLCNNIYKPLHKRFEKITSPQVENIFASRGISTKRIATDDYGSRQRYYTWADPR